MCLLLDAVGWISPLGMAHTRPAGIGLGGGVRGVWSKVLEALIAMGYSTGRLSLDKVAVDSTTVKAGKGGSL